MKLTEKQKELIEATENKVLIDGKYYVPYKSWVELHDLDKTLINYKAKTAISKSGIKNVSILTGNVNPKTKSPCKIKVYCVDDENLDKFFELIELSYITIDNKGQAWLSPSILNKIFECKDSWSLQTARRKGFKRNKKGQYLLNDFIGIKKYK